MAVAGTCCAAFGSIDRARLSSFSSGTWANPNHSLLSLSIVPSSRGSGTWSSTVVVVVGFVSHFSSFLQADLRENHDFFLDAANGLTRVHLVQTQSCSKR